MLKLSCFNKRIYKFNHDDIIVITILNRDYVNIFLYNNGGNIKIKVVTVRLLESLHTELSVEARKEGISLNQLCLTKLSKPLAWYAELAEATKEGKE